MTIEEIVEESEEGDAVSPLQSGSNTDRIFSEPVTDDGKRRVRSPTFPRAAAPAVDDQRPTKEGEESELGRRTPDAHPPDPEPLSQPQLSPKVRTGPKLRPRMALSSEKSREFNRKLSVEENDQKALQLSAAARLSAVVKHHRRSMRERAEDPSESQIALRLRSLKESLEGPQSLNRRLEAESADPQKSHSSMLVKAAPKAGMPWRNMSKDDIRKPAAEPSKGHLTAGGRVRSIRALIDKIAADYSHLRSNCESTAVSNPTVETARDRRSLIALGRSFRPATLLAKRKTPPFAPNAPLAPVKEETEGPRRQFKKGLSLFNGLGKRVSLL